MKHVCFVASRLFPGGFTSSMLNMIDQLQKHDVKVSIIFLDAASHEISTDVLKDVEILPFQLTFAKPWKIGRYLRWLGCRIVMNADSFKMKMTKDPEKLKRLKTEHTQAAILISIMLRMPEVDFSAYDCVISWEELTCNDFLAFNVKAKKKIGYVHPEYGTVGYSKRMDKAVFKRLDKIISVSQGNNDSMARYFPEFAPRFKYIRNVINTESITEKSKMYKPYNKSNFDIVTVCRLSVYHKGLDRLMRVACRLNQEGLDYQWYIVGEGEGRAYLEQTIAENNLTNIHLTGNKDNPYPYMKDADLFVLLSNYEGRPVVVDESLILNTPVLVTEYEAAHEQVDDTCGFVMPMDDKLITDKLKELISNSESLNDKKSYLIDCDTSKYETIDGMLEEI